MSFPSLKQTAAAIRDRSLTAQEHLNRKFTIISQRNPSLNAIVHVNEEMARARALTIDNHSLGMDGDLLGTTFSVRLSISAAGLPLSNGSKASEPVISLENASLVQRLIDAGASCIGKGNIAERGKSYFTDNPRYGRTNHFTEPDFSPGGSGGGDAVAVATGMVDFAIGADAGGSVRIPANFCGLYGLTATHGVLSEAGLGSQTTAIMRLLKGPGILSRSAADLESVFSVVAGFDSHDPNSSATVLPALDQPPRIRVCDALNGVTPDRRILATIEAACAQLKSAGAIIDRRPLPLLESLAEPFVILAAQAQLLLEDTLALRSSIPLDLDQEGPHLKVLRSRLGSELPPLSADELLYRWHQIDLARNLMAQHFDDFDFLLLPVSATLPVRHNSPFYQVDGKELRTEQVFQFSTVINALGLPAVAVPGTAAKDKFPTGFQIAAPRYGEQRLLKLLREMRF